MIFQPHDFIAYSVDAQRVSANLEQSYSAWLDAEREHLALPSTMFWAQKPPYEYLTSKSADGKTTSSHGARSAETEAAFEQFTEAKAAAEIRRKSIAAQVNERSRLARTRALRLPVLPEQPGRILRALDLNDLLGTDVLLVGTNAFLAYEMACGARFPTGAESTEDFDLTWCRDTKAALALMPPSAAAGAPPAAQRTSLLKALRTVDKTYRINPRKPYQALNAANYEVELLAAPSTHPVPQNQGFDPMATLTEQEWLLMGRPLSIVIATSDNHAAALAVPDPRYMALHKLWLGHKAERNPFKKDKDLRQGAVLMAAVQHRMQSSYPLNIDFVLDLPADLRPTFDAWCARTGFVPLA